MFRLVKRNASALALWRIPLTRFILLRFILALCLFLAALTAEARCVSVDYRDHLNATQKAQLQREVARLPFANGNHWIATKGNRTLHIIGTMHTGDARMGAIVRRLRPIIAGADAVLLEVTSTVAEASFEDVGLFREYMLLPANQSLRAMMSASGWTALVNRLSAEGMDPRTIDRLQPWFASELLDQVICVSTLPSFGGRGLDDRIERVAIRNRVPIGSLETVSQSFGALLAMPKRDHVRLMELELARQTSGQPLTYNKLDDAYFEEAIGEIMVMARWSLYTEYDAPRRELDRLYDSLFSAILTRRNRNWMPVLLNTKGQTIVAAMGAAHLPGRDGILNLLKNRGYKLTRAGF